MERTLVFVRSSRSIDIVHYLVRLLLVGKAVQIWQFLSTGLCDSFWLVIEGEVYAC